MWHQNRNRFQLLMNKLKNCQSHVIDKNKCTNLLMLVVLMRLFFFGLLIQLSHLGLTSAVAKSALSPVNLPAMDLFRIVFHLPVAGAEAKVLFDNFGVDNPEMRRLLSHDVTRNAFRDEISVVIQIGKITFNEC